MVDTKLKTLLTVISAKSYTKAAERLGLTQPAVSHHIHSLEDEYHIKIFYPGTKKIRLTPEGKILEKYAKRIRALHSGLLSDLEDYKRGAHRYIIGVTPSAEGNLVPNVIASYCSLHSEIKIIILTDTIKKISAKLQTYDLDFAIVEGRISAPGLYSRLLDTDHLSLIVSPEHPFARRRSITIDELKKERLIIRPSAAGTRQLFENCLRSHSESLRNFNISMEIDNVSTIKELVMSGFGVSIAAHSTCLSEEQAGLLKVVPIENFHMLREINIVCRQDFSNVQMLEELFQIYHSTLPVQINA